MLAELDFRSYEESVPALLESCGLARMLKGKRLVILKPNLTCNKAPPTTTPVRFVERIVKYIKENSDAKIIIAEGSGGNSTQESYHELGYRRIAERYGIELIDLNTSEIVTIKSEMFLRFDEIYFPKIMLDGFVISLPILKEHSQASITVSLKNMLGCFPSRYYSEGKPWKGKIHKWPIEYSIHDILVCKFPDFAVCDANIAQLGNEVHGRPKKIGKLIAGSPLDVDKRGAELLGHEWRRIKHIVLAEKLAKNIGKIK